MAKNNNKDKDLKKELDKLDKLEDKLEVEVANENSQDTVIAQDIEIDNTNDENIQESEIDNIEQKDIKKNNTRLLIYLTAIIISLLIIFAGICLFNKLNFNVYKGVVLAGKDISGLNELQTEQLIKVNQHDLAAKNIKIKQDDKILLDIDSSDFDLMIDETKTLENIMKFGRSKNIFKNTYDILKSMIIPNNIEVAYTYNESKLNGIVKEVKEIIVGKTIDDSYTLDEKKYVIIINKGKAGKTIDEVKFTKQLINGLALKNIKEIEIDLISTNPTKLDVDVIYTNIAREARDAYIDRSLGAPKFITHQVGLNFDKQILKNYIDSLAPEKSGEFKLTVTNPRVKLSDITWNLYNYQISTYKTYFSTVDQNRVNNLRVALKILNGKIVMPGDVFSYNKTIGKTTTARGFKIATVFNGGTLAKEVGGGICQTVTTLYNAALYANLSIVERKNHSLPVGYVPSSRDATVYYPSIDFKFRNNRNYPIKIVTAFNASGNLSVSIFGTKEESEPVVSISSRTISYIPYTTQYINDSTEYVGTQKVVTKGVNGYISEAFKTVRLNGKITTTFLSRDTYKSLTKIISRGTKILPTPEPEPEPDISE